MEMTTAHATIATIGIDLGKKSTPLNLAARAFLANRGVWEPIYIHGPSVSFAHTEADVDRYLDRLDEWLRRLLESCS